MLSAGQRNESNCSSPPTTQVDALLNRFSELVEHVQEITFPPLRKGPSAPADVSKLGKLRQILFIASSPLPSMFAEETLERSAWVLLGWLTASIYWWSLASVLIESILGTPRPPRPETPFWVEILVWPLMTALIIGSLLAYWRWVEFLQDRRYSVRWRLLLVAVFAGLTLSSPYWLLKPELREQLPLLSPRQIKWLVVDYLAFIVPACTFFYTLAIETVIMTTWFLRASLKYLWAAHNPLPKEVIREIALRPIPMQDDAGREWYLADLSQAELHMLIKWAEANREGTDKRLIPTTVLFGVLGIFANTQAFSDMIDGILESLRLLDSARKTVTVGAIGAMVALFVYVLSRLFLNLVTQSLIIEACIVAEYAHRHSQGSGVETESRKRRTNWWRRLLQLLWKR